MTELELANALSRIEARIARIESAITNEQPTQFQRDSYSVSEAATILNRKPFTVREWARLGRIYAHKRECGRGNHAEWTISGDEIERILNEGLLPLRR